MGTVTARRMTLALGGPRARTNAALADDAHPSIAGSGSTVDAMRKRLMEPA